MKKCGNPFCLRLECDPIQRAFCREYMESENTPNEVMESINTINAYRCLGDMMETLNVLEKQIYTRNRVKYL